MGWVGWAGWAGWVGWLAAWLVGRQRSVIGFDKGVRVLPERDIVFFQGLGQLDCSATAVAIALRVLGFRIVD